MGIKRAHDLEPQSGLERDLIELLHRHGFGITSFEVEENNIDTGIPKMRFGRIHVTMERDATEDERRQAEFLRDRQYLGELSAQCVEPMDEYIERKKREAREGVA